MFSIIIPTNNQDYLDIIISKLLTMVSKDDQIIVANYGPDHFQEKYDNVIYYQSNSTEPEILNHTIKNIAKQEYIVYLSQTCIPAKNLLLELEKCVGRNKIIFCRTDRFISENSCEYDNWIDLGKKSTPVEAKHCRMNCFVFNRYIGISIGLFNTSFVNEYSCSAGILFSLLMKETKKCSLVYEPKAIVYNKNGNKKSKEEEKIITLYSKQIKENQKETGLTFIVPNRQSNVAQILEHCHDKDKDKVETFVCSPLLFTKNINKAIINSENNFIVLVNPLFKPVVNEAVLSNIRAKIHDDFILIYGTSSHLSLIDENLMICFSKKQFKQTHSAFNTVLDYQKYIINLFEPNKRVDLYEPKSLSITPHLLPSEDEDIETIPMQGGSIVPQKMIIENNSKISIIIPFQYLGDRWELFVATIKCLYEHTKNDPDFEIIVHEIGKTRKLNDDFLECYKIKYMFSSWNGVFHRAWALNVPVRHLSTGDKLVFFDADVIVTKEWFNEVKERDNSTWIGWGRMINLSKTGTLRYLKNGTISESKECVDKIRTPTVGGAEGGITVISRKIFFEIGGWPEDFNGSYGGEDNAMIGKLTKLGYME